MSRPFRLASGVQAEIREAADWYHERDSQVTIRFLASVDRATRRAARVLPVPAPACTIRCCAEPIALGDQLGHPHLLRPLLVPGKPSRDVREHRGDVSGYRSRFHGVSVPGSCDNDAVVRGLTRHRR